ncbi:TPA: AAA family ATPase [Candidatus Peregrinibacteria bacterium]|nr:AAA family ATPase [Candidatus Peregrinibacteria bacterium]
MQIICISGKIGSGKTTFSHKFIQNLSHYQIHKKSILYIDIDNFVHLYKNEVYKKLHIKHKKLQKILFYSGSHKNFLTEKTWYNLNKIFKPIIINYIKNIIQKNTQKNTSHYKIIIFDIALQNYFIEAINKISIQNNMHKKLNIHYINLENSLYTKLFLLQKYRNISFSKTVKILQQQI